MDEVIIIIIIITIIMISLLVNWVTTEKSAFYFSDSAF